MKKITSLAAILLTSFSFAQDHDHTHYGPANPVPCANNLEQERAYKADPSLRIQDSISQAEFQDFYEDFYANDYDPYARSSYVIPVVVHICHIGGAENISDEQVYDAIEKLNQDYSATNADVNTTVAPFDGIIGNTDIEFRLATRDPGGNCHKGITRTFTQNTYHDGGSGLRNDVQSEHGTWPQNKYMNVFVCIDPNGAAGYTNNPGMWYSPTGMGGSIYMRHDYMGTIGTASPTAKHTLSHEVGHWLNLSHCWGGNNSPGQASACNDDDGVDDTPRTIGWTVCNISGNTCSNDAVDGYWGSDVIDNVQNIMEYSYCSTMFTQGQSARMIAAIQPGAIADRDNLWQSSNLIATGTDGPGDVCEALFSSDTKVICVGSTVTFTDESYHNVTSRNWTFSGGSPASSSAAEPVITYNTPGVYPVSLTVSDGSNNESITENNYIVVLNTTGESIPYHEGFEFLSTIPDNDNWMIENLADDQDWSLATNAGSDNTTHSAVLQNYYTSEGSVDNLISGTIDLSSVGSTDDLIMTFEYAYRKKNTSTDEKLKVYVSKDCGETWVLRKQITGDGLGTAVSSSNFVPTSDDWTFVEITTINSPYYVENFRFKFEFTGDIGNNIYIDNINLYPASMTTLDENVKENAISVFPNPTNGMTTIQMYGEQGVNYTITLYSTLGQQVGLIHQGELTAGLNNFEYDTAELSKGVYVVQIEGEGKVQTIKLIKE